MLVVIAFFGGKRPGIKKEDHWWEGSAKDSPLADRGIGPPVSFHCGKRVRTRLGMICFLG